MKYILVLCDGMADFKIDALGGKTPLEAAKKPNIDFMAKTAMQGFVKTVPDGMKPGSDVANLSALGYDAKACYTGRSPLEALSLGIDLQPTDVALRCNLVTLSDDEPYEAKTMIDYSSGEITTAESELLMKSVAQSLNDNTFEFYPGVSYRHCLVCHNGRTDSDLTPPHDITGKKIADYLPKGYNADVYLSLMKKSAEILKSHPVNLERKRQGKRTADSIWLWGQGTKPRLQNFYERYGIKGAMISAVDLLKGIAVGSGMQSIDVEGATGTIDTNFDGKAKAALDALKNNDFCFIHLEAPDECGHQKDAKGKTRSIELIDEKIIGAIIKGMKDSEFKMLVMPDHFTPIATGTHDATPVPFLMYSSSKPLGKGETFNEFTPTGKILTPFELINLFFDKEEK
ncbi:proposed homoserine kinase [Acidaminococcus sp. CAG:917]|nr:proposed homoserine kinase [Acidaminococcus sp. CAG:917]